MKTEECVYRDGDLECHGYLAYDEAQSGERPGIVVVHEAWGLGEQVKNRARMLAQLGYVALAADMFGNGKQPADFDEAIGIIGALKGNIPVLRARAAAALATLTGLPQVDTSRLGAIGYCFGGTTALEMARSGTDLKGVVSFHGDLSTSSPAEPGVVNASVLACTGADDPMVDVDQVNGFEAEMTKAGVDWQVHKYGGTVHSFTNPDADGSIAPGILYNERADKRSWAAMKAFFEEVFD